LVDEPQCDLVTTAVLHEDEHNRNGGNRRAEYIEQDFRRPDSRKLAAKFFRQEPVDGSHETHEEPYHHRVDVKDLGDIEMEKSEKKIGIDVVVG
jgi:hypothetical protein